MLRLRWRHRAHVVVFPSIIWINSYHDDLEHPDEHPTISKLDSTNGYSIDRLSSCGTPKLILRIPLGSSTSLRHSKDLSHLDTAILCHQCPLNFLRFPMWHVMKLKRLLSWHDDQSVSWNMIKLSLVPISACIWIYLHGWKFEIQQPPGNGYVLQIQRCSNTQEWTSMIPEPLTTNPSPSLVWDQSWTHNAKPQMLGQGAIQETNAIMKKRLPRNTGYHFIRLSSIFSTISLCLCLSLSLSIYINKLYNISCIYVHCIYSKYIYT